MTLHRECTAEQCRTQAAAPHVFPRRFVKSGLYAAYPLGKVDDQDDAGPEHIGGRAIGFHGDRSQVAGNRNHPLDRLGRRVDDRKSSRSHSSQRTAGRQRDHRTERRTAQPRQFAARGGIDH